MALLGLENQNGRVSLEDFQRAVEAERGIELQLVFYFGRISDLLEDIKLKMGHLQTVVQKR
eukprot:UN26640